VAADAAAALGETWRESLGPVVATRETGVEALGARHAARGAARGVRGGEADRSVAWLLALAVKRSVLAACGWRE
jgi:hypothetical protein